MAEDREELVGGTHPWLVSLWLVLVGGTHPGGGSAWKKLVAGRLETYYNSELTYYQSQIGGVNRKLALPITYTHFVVMVTPIRDQERGVLNSTIPL